MAWYQVNLWINVYRRPKTQYCFASDQTGHSSQSCPSGPILGPDGCYNPPREQRNPQLAPHQGCHPDPIRRPGHLSCCLGHNQIPQSEPFFLQLAAVKKWPSPSFENSNTDALSSKGLVSIPTHAQHLFLSGQLKSKWESSNLQESGYRAVCGGELNYTYLSPLSLTYQLIYIYARSSAWNLIWTTIWTTFQSE